MQYESVPFSTAFIELGGTYVSKKVKAATRLDMKCEISNQKM